MRKKRQRRSASSKKKKKTRAPLVHKSTMFILEGQEENQAIETIVHMHNLEDGDATLSQCTSDFIEAFIELFGGYSLTLVDSELTDECWRLLGMNATIKRLALHTDVIGAIQLPRNLEFLDIQALYPFFHLTERRFVETVCIGDAEPCKLMSMENIECHVAYVVIHDLNQADAFIHRVHPDVSRLVIQTRDPNLATHLVKYLHPVRLEFGCQFHWTMLWQLFKFYFVAWLLSADASFTFN